MPTLTVHISDSTAADLERLLALLSKAGETNTHGALTIEGLAAMLLEDAGLVIRRPGSWEGAKMADLLAAHGYARF